MGDGKRAGEERKGKEEEGRKKGREPQKGKTNLNTNLAYLENSFGSECVRGRGVSHRTRMINRSLGKDKPRVRESTI